MKPTVCLTFDVEDWFCSSNFDRGLSHAEWEALPRRVVEPTIRILAMLKSAKVKATFFVLGWSAERAPELVQRISEAGHEVACHGYHHDVLNRLTPETFAEDLTAALRAIEPHTSEPVRGYRAPSCSITEWALDQLPAFGFTYDSSFFPARHDKYGRIAAAPHAVSRVRPGLAEVPVAVHYPFGKTPIPWGGGAYFRLFPYNIYRRGMRAILARQRWFNFYLHPWEFDPNQPVLRQIDRVNRARHRMGLASTEPKFRRLLADFRDARFLTLGELVEEELAA